MLDDRRMAVLRAIVEDYVSTGEPVGSRGLVDRHRLSVSPATIRNDMAVLEEAGLITQPHTSAGRVPTDAGYRLFVDQLATVKPLSLAERRAIQTLLDGPLDLDQIVGRAVRALAQLTHQVAVIQYPSLRMTRVRHVELIELAPARCLLVMITDAGRVEQRFIELPIPLGPEATALLRSRLNAATAGPTLEEAFDDLDDLWIGFAEPVRPAVQAVVKTLKEIPKAGRQERLVAAGTSNLARAASDFRSFMPVLEAIEEQVVLLKLLTEMSADSGQVAIRIGHETTQAGLEETSLVAAGYGPGRAVAHLGVLGPTRMDYPGSIAVVRAIALYLSRILAA
ncbi:MAG: heat-inducible transcriptional repressor HrcA [Bifidobacteriaceae bacterium]|jgi:heat-inducible transcriptional repressor|nr:heat-inducible transcriptional repressor HrcA [Bifidobacteriaceae bacterium]